ncbi:MAG: hypothetical protein OXI22_03260 [Defluviicoccus sp.]|nr:hypothetical protein [Defluviicoccus sp.]MDE0382878.1 hypothetical protein [Defluviicoccus sp.]
MEIRGASFDTVKVDARPGPGQSLRASVRPMGFDAPELRGKCAAEREAAAKAALERPLPAGAEVRLAGMRKDRYAGRAGARVLTLDDEDVIGAPLAAGHGRPYDGGRRAGRGG